MFSLNHGGYRRAKLYFGCSIVRSRREAVIDISRSGNSSLPRFAKYVAGSTSYQNLLRFNYFFNRPRKHFHSLILITSNTPDNVSFDNFLFLCRNDAEVSTHYKPFNISQNLLKQLQTSLNVITNFV